MFQIVCLTAAGPEPVLDSAGEPLFFEDGKSAAARARTLSEENCKKYQPRRVHDPKWREREQARLDDGTYRALPWARQTWWRKSEYSKTHYAHVSVKKPGLVAFTESEEKGAADIQTALKCGRYLTRFFSDVLSAEQIRDLTVEFSRLHEAGVLLFADTADEIERVYREGPESCMSSDDYRASNGWGKWRSPFHPVRVYAHGDLQVAYLQDEDGFIMARALVWPARKTHSRIYGDEARLKQLLDEAGYRFAPPYGAKIARHFIEEKGCYVVPYIDRGQSSSGGSAYCADCDTHLEICSDGDIDCSQLNGLGPSRYEDEPDDPSCDNCSDTYPELEGSNIFIGRHAERCWCAHCTDNYAFRCERCERHHASARTDSHHLPSLNQTWCEFCVGNDAFYCDVNEEYYPNDEMVIMANGEYWSRDAFDECGFVCLGDGGNYPDSQKVVLADGTEWSQAYYDAHGGSCSVCEESFPQDDLTTYRNEPCCPACASNEAREDGLRAMYGMTETADESAHTGN